MTETATEREKRLRESYIKHAALAQLYRWCQHYDAKSAVANQLDMLDSAVRVSSNMGESTGCDDYAASVRRLPAHWQDARSLRTSRVHLQDDGTITIAGEIEHLNVGIDPDGGVMRSAASCNVVLRPTDTILPKITEIRVVETEFEQADEFRPAYAGNRIRSLVHYFTALVENPGRDPAPFRELLAQEMCLHYTDPPIDSLDAVTAWVAGALSSVVASNHVVSDIGLEELSDREYLAKVGMQSEAMFPDGTGIASRNTQSWVVGDDRSERFARIRKITIRRDELRRF
jgi:hypothetical protein